MHGLAVAINLEAIISALGNHLLKIQHCFDLSEVIKLKLMIYTLLTTRPATINISISLTIVFILLRGQR